MYDWFPKVPQAFRLVVKGDAFMCHVHSRAFIHVYYMKWICYYDEYDADVYVCIDQAAATFPCVRAGSPLPPKSGSGPTPIPPTDTHWPHYSSQKSLR